MGLFERKNDDIEAGKNTSQITYVTPEKFMEKSILFKFFEGGYGGPNLYYSIEKEDDSFLFKTYYEYSNLKNNFLEVYEKEEIDYNSFISSIKKFTKDWSLEYYNSDIMDGTQWHISFLTEDKEYSGSNNFPDFYEDVMKLMKEYFPRIPSESDVKLENQVPFGGVASIKNEKKYNRKSENNSLEISFVSIQLKNKSSYYIFSFNKKENQMEFLLLDRKEFNKLEELPSPKRVDKKYYEELLNRYIEITKDWQESYVGNKDIEWKIEEKSDVERYRSGMGEVPSNWSSFIDLLMEYESLYNNIK